jgi:putative DNA primase/helicase
MNPIELTRALKGKWHGSYGTAKCPAHEDRSPSLAIGIAKTGKVLVKCHAGCTQESVIDALRRFSLWSGEPCNLRPFTHPSEDTNRNGEYALRLWSEAKPAQGTIVETYLASRGITMPIPDSLRFHPRLKYLEGGTWPAMVGLVSDGATGRPLAIHRTFLKPDGSDKAPVPKPKMMLGPCQGGAVRLAEATDWVGVGEGIETCLSVLQETGKPAWAALSTTGLKALELPGSILDVIILRDNDPAGYEAARVAGYRWANEGRRVKIANPAPCNDFNELMLRDAK